MLPVYAHPGASCSYRVPHGGDSKGQSGFGSNSDKSAGLSLDTLNPPLPLSGNDLATADALSAIGAEPEVRFP
jgi:hypothetical protein